MRTAMKIPSLSASILALSLSILAFFLSLGAAYTSVTRQPVFGQPLVDLFEAHRQVVPPPRDAQRLAELEQAPTLARVEELAGRWDLVVVECNLEFAEERADKKYLWWVKVNWANSASDFTGFGPTIEAAAQAAVGDYYVERARAAAEAEAARAVREQWNEQLDCVDCDRGEVR